MADKDKKPEHSKLADIERLREIRYMTKGAGAKKRRTVYHTQTTLGPTGEVISEVDKLREAVAKVAKKAAKKKPKKRSRR